MINEKYEQLKIITDQFIDILHDLYGFYVDVVMSLKLYKQRIVESQRKGVPRITFASGSPDNPDVEILHSESIGKIVDRNSEEGYNIIILRQNIIAMIVGHWNENIRKRIEEILKKNKDDIKSDIMGDLNKMRNDILKNKGRVGNAIKNKIIKFKKDGYIYISAETFENIFREIIKCLNELLMQETGRIGYQDASLNLKAKEWHRSTQHVVINN